MPYERKTSDILISEELRAMLSQIESQSLVAQLLLKKRHAKEELAEDHVNWISVSSQDKTKISYLTQERAGQIPEEDLWTSQKRFHAKPGGFISKVFKNISGRDVESFSTLFRNLSSRPEFSFSIVRGESIRSLYLYDRYASDCGSLGGSCMRYESCQEYMDIYCENKDKVSMLAMFNSYDELLGRAILWEFDGYKIMDRIYTINDEKYAFYFKEWAMSNNYMFKSAQNWYDTMSFEGAGGKKSKLKLQIQLGSHRYGRYPYMDTFKFYSQETGSLYNYQPEGGFYTICSPDGSKYGPDYLVLDALDDVFRYRHDAVFVRGIDGWTNSCNACYSGIMDEYIICQEATYDELIGEYVYRDESKNPSCVSERREEVRARRAKREAERAEKAKQKEDSASELNLQDIETGGVDFDSLVQRLIGSSMIPRELFARRSRRAASSETQPEPEPES